MGILSGLLGSEVGHFFGSKIGRAVGGKRGQKKGAEIGRVAGGVIGAAAPEPFKKGGKVKKTGVILAHKGEHVLPADVKPTKAQKEAIKKRGGKL